MRNWNEHIAFYANAGPIIDNLFAKAKVKTKGSEDQEDVNTFWGPDSFSGILFLDLYEMEFLKVIIT